jgi:bifunctional non-homologous end joining protein LigD
LKIASPATVLEPMLAAAGRKLFDSPDWSFELKYAGFRALLIIDGAAVQFKSERGSDLVRRLPEIGPIGKSLKRRSLVLDGVVIAGDGSVPSFRTLLHRYAKFGITDLKPKERVPVKYVAFDLLAIDGRSLVGQPLKSRQQQLRKLIPRSAGQLLRPKTALGSGADLFAEAESRGFSGIVAKRLDSIYEPGKRAKSWLKFKTKVEQEEARLR